MGTGSLRRQVSLPGAAECWNPLLFWNCVCTSSFHWAGSWAALCCSCLQAFAVLPAPCVGTVPFPPWGIASCLAAAHGCTSLPSQLKLLRTRWSRKQCWKELQETLITIPATAREEIFDSQGHLRAFKDAESRQQEAFSLPAQLVLYYWLLHTVPTWLFESTLKIFRYFYFIFLCNLTSVFGMFPARVGVGKQSWLGITGEIILDRAGSHQPCKLKYMFSTAVMHSDWNLWFTNSVGAIFLMAWGRGNRFVLCLEVKRLQI